MNNISSKKIKKSALMAAMSLFSVTFANNPVELDDILAHSQTIESNDAQNLDSEAIEKGDAAHKVKDHVNDAVDSAKEAVNNAAESLAGTDNVSSHLEHIQDAAKQKLEEGKSKAKDLAHEVEQGAQHAVDSAKHVVQHVADVASKATDDSLGHVQDYYKSYIMLGTVLGCGAGFFAGYGVASQNKP